MFNYEKYNLFKFGLVGLGWDGFYDISTIIGYIMPHSVYTFILNIYDLVWLDIYGLSTTVGYLRTK